MSYSNFREFPKIFIDNIGFGGIRFTIISPYQTGILILYNITVDILDIRCVISGLYGREFSTTEYNDKTRLEAGLISRDEFEKGVLYSLPSVINSLFEGNFYVVCTSMYHNCHINMNIFEMSSQLSLYVLLLKKHRYDQDFIVQQVIDHIDSTDHHSSGSSILQLAVREPRYSHGPGEPDIPEEPDISKDGQTVYIKLHNDFLDEKGEGIMAIEINGYTYGDYDGDLYCDNIDDYVEIVDENDYLDENNKLDEERYKIACDLKEADLLYDDFNRYIADITDCYRTERDSMYDYRY
jgi:hypothetical protein